MKRTTISLPDELADILAREAQRRELSISEVVRSALLDHLSISVEGTRRLPFIALGRSGTRSTARDSEAILAKEWGRARRR
jgi:Arc/MetJ-type ribon-helix-helix transcriptional regulator